MSASTCESSGWVSIALGPFLEGSATPSERRRLADHLEVCPACRGSFQRAVRLAGEVNRGPRTERARARRGERRAHQRRMALQGAFARRRGPRAARLRIVFLPLFFGLLLSRFPLSAAHAPRAFARALRGEVHVGQVPLPAGALRSLPAGALIHTGSAGRARLSFERGGAVLGPDSWIWLESANGARVRMGGGTINVWGDVAVTSRAGVVSVRSGAAHIDASQEHCAVAALHGDVRFADADGESAVEPGVELGVELAPDARP